MLSKKQIKEAESLKGFLEFVPEDKSSVQNKKLLLEMAKRGEPKPIGNHPLTNVFRMYKDPTSATYDQEFSDKIRKLCPEWLQTLSEKVLDNKKKLLEMARQGEFRPVSGKHPLGNALVIYITKSSRNYDAVFEETILDLRPDWFRNLRVVDKKNQLLEIAKEEGCKKPSKESSLGRSLREYVRVGGESYDVVFDKQIRKLAPHWFMDTAAESKKQLLQMAKNGQAKPIAGKHPLGSSLKNYTNPNNPCYDPIFDKQMSGLVPSWFVHPSEITDSKKQQLLEVAKNGEPRPSYNKHSLGIVLSHYTKLGNDCYDPVFDKKIRKLRPDWFLSQSDIANNKKKQLIQIAICGDSRPSQSKHPLGVVLSQYTNSNNLCYDPIFDKEIRKLRPDWFVPKGSRG